MGCSIFIASSTRIRSPSATVSPSEAATFTMVPCMGLVSSSPPPFAAPRAERDLRVLAAGLAAGLVPPPRSGRDTSMRLPLTSTTTVVRSSSSESTLPGAPEYMGMVLLNSVSIQRVCTLNSPPSAGAKAGSSSTTRWNGTTVGIPSMVSSARARRARCRACSRSAPVTMSLASIESKLPPITSPATKPESQRTPGPVGTVSFSIVPGAGMKERPASSPLIRNSKE